MRIVIAPDSFKESATSIEISSAMARGVRRAVDDVEIVNAPMADGGEGTCEAYLACNDGEWVECEVSNPLRRPVKARYALNKDKQTAVIEMASAAGLALLKQRDRDPMRTTTRGVGELMADALDKGVSRIIVGLGGSSTNDGGAGMAQALGISLMDKHGKELPAGAEYLHRLTKIDTSGCHPKLKDCEIIGACDVSNPLCGPSGASRVYALQKGASESDIAHLDRGLENLGRQIEQQLHCLVVGLPGAGAAGGLGAGLVAFTGAKLKKGVEILAELCALESKIKDAHLVLTGEGQLDDQSLNGKTPIGVAKMARNFNIPVIAIVGSLGSGYAACYDAGITAAFSIFQRPMSRIDAMHEVDMLVSETTEAAVRLWSITRQMTKETR